MSLSSIWQEFTAWWEGTAIGKEIDSAAGAALSELEAIAPTALTAVTEATAGAILPGITSGGSVSEIMAAGIAAAEAAFKTQAATVSATTISTFTSALHNSVATQVAAGAVTPAAAAPAA